MTHIKKIISKDGNPDKEGEYDTNVGKAEFILFPVSRKGWWAKKGVEYYYEEVPTDAVSLLISQECAKCKSGGMVNEPNKPERHDCAHCEGEGYIPSKELYELMCSICYSGHLDDRITLSEAQKKIISFFNLISASLPRTVLDREELLKWVEEEINKREVKLKTEQDEDGLLSRNKIESYKTGLYYYKCFKEKLLSKK